ncbi:MAG: VWA domain-containing protein [Ideonella sp.]|nr:VWA domain-containing protein [Ideonella sp.]
MRDLDAPYDRLAALPRELWLPGLVTACGDCVQRLDEIPQWLDALVQGALPGAALNFGDEAAVGALRSAVGELGLPALCKDSPALAQQVLRTLLWHLDRINDHLPWVARAEAIARVAAEFRAEWTIEKAGWEAMLALLQGLGDLPRLRRDEMRGLLNSREWREAERIAALLPHLQPLAELIACIGRAAPHPGAAPARSEAPREAQPRAVRWRETVLPDAPGELKGIRLSDRIERMLSSEAQQITHSVLHKLWRARLAESRLLTYESEAVLQEQVADPQARQCAPAAAADPAPLARGPMLVCIDTSGSMRGAPENVAKAVAIEALRVAHREQRACRLIAFGGKSELLERELDLGRGGLTHLLDFIGQGFDGGTDLQAPLERVIELVTNEGWRSADLLLVSDGEFGCTEVMLRQLDQAKAALGLRVQGVLVGDRETLGLLETCDDIYWLRGWRRFEGDAPQREGFVPVHTPSLTAIYFPGALSPRAARMAARRPAPS